MINVGERKQFMKQEHKLSMGNLPRTHANCKEKTGVYRPGKTAKDRALKGAI